MSKVVFTEDVREVYWAQTNEYNIKIGEKNYKVRVFEDSNGCEERMHPKKKIFYWLVCVLKQQMVITIQ